MIPVNITNILSKTAEWKDEEIATLCDFFNKDNRAITDEEWMEGFQGISQKVIGKSPNEKIAQLMSDVASSFHESSPRSFFPYQQMTHDCAIASLMVKKKEDFLKYVQAHLYNAMAQITPDSTNQSMDYYSFRGITSYSINEITNEQISLAHPRSFNDPLDTLLNWRISNEIKNFSGKSLEEQEFILQLKKATEHIKMRCLIGAKKKAGDNLTDVYVEDLPVLMWSHYANSHKGMCVKYRFKKDFFKEYMVGSKELLFICPVIYEEKIQQAGNQKLLMGNELLIKSKDWEYENEKRMIFYSMPDASSDIKSNVSEFPMLDCKGAIQSIYLGVKCSDADVRLVEKAIGDKDIQLFKMEIDSNNPTRLKPIRIG